MTVRLGRDDLDVWFVPADRPEVRSIERAHSRTVLARVLARYVPIPADAIELGHRPCGSCRSEAHGAPFVEQDPSLCLSISRTRGMACIAVSRQAVGVDVELVRSVHPSLVSRELLSEAEMRSVTTATDPDEAFMQVWVAAEATLKASQSGIVAGLRRHAASARGLSVDGFVSVRLDAPPGFVAAVAHPPRGTIRIRCRTWQQRDPAGRCHGDGGGSLVESQP